ncbi:hypothetical protein PIROE2DRAFT_60663 [Piromyces sp. E2]|nr:hypothetical protein PIROE2DRAFT_60663 [Piromyces sp. E2]|eukprot:OUM64461.1 hypothetical protein PIROE2DRAFT_60663 [Piromyces sp. E2]
MLGNCPTGSRIAFYIPRYEYQRNDNTQNKPKIQSNEWIKTCKYFIERNDKLQKGDNSLPLLVNKEYLSNFLDNSIEGNNTNVVLYGDKDEDITTDINESFHIRTITSIITEAYKKIDNLSTKLENENLVKKIREKSINIPKLVFSLVVKTTYKPNERSLIRKYESLTVLNIIDFTTIQTNMDNDGYSAEVKTILNIITGLKSNLFYSPYLNPPYWSQTQYSPRDCQTLIVLFSQASAESLDAELNDLLISLNILSDPKKGIEIENNKDTKTITDENIIRNKNDNNDENIDRNDNEGSNDNIDNNITNYDNNDETMNNPNNMTILNKKNNRKTNIKNKTPEQIDALINNYQKQIKDYFDKDIAKTNYIERIENELENCKKVLNSYSISDSFLRKKFVEMNYNMKMYKEQIDELEQMVNEKERQLLEQKQEKQKMIEEEKKLLKTKLEKYSQTDDIQPEAIQPVKSQSKQDQQSNEPTISENEELLKNEIQLYKDNEIRYVEMLEDIELTKSFKLNNFEQNKDIIEYYLTNLKCKIDNITQDLKSINVLENTKAEDYNDDTVSLNRSTVVNEQSSIINNQNDNPISYEIYRLNEILKEKEKENCLLKDKIKKLESTPVLIEKEKEKEESTIVSTPKIMNDPIEDDIYTIQINRIRELEKNLHDVTCERDNNISKISDLEFSLMKAQTLILSNTLNKKEEERINGNNSNVNDAKVNNNLNNNNNNENNDPNTTTNQNTSFYLSEFSSFIPPSPPSVSAFSPPTSPTSIASEESEPLYLTENIFQNLRKYKSKKGSKSHEKSKNHSRSSSNKNKDNINYYNSDNNFELNSPSRSINMYKGEEPFHNIDIPKPKYNKQSNRNTLYICDGLDSIYNSIEDKKSRQQITEKLSSLCLDSPKKRDFDKEHRRANSIDCFNIESNKYYNKPNLDLLCKNKSCSFANYEDVKESKKEEDIGNKSYQISIRKNENDSVCDNNNNIINNNNEDFIKDYSNHDDNQSINNDERDTYVKVPQMVVEYDRSRITIKSEEVEKFIPLNYILQEKKSHHHSIRKSSQEVCSSPSSYTYENPSVISSSSRSHYPTKATKKNIDIKSPSISSNSKKSKTHTKTRKSSKIHQSDQPDNYVDHTSNATIKNEPYQSQNAVIDENRMKNISSKSSIDKDKTPNHEKDLVSSHKNDNTSDSKSNMTFNKINSVSNSNPTNYSYNKYGNSLNYNNYNNYNVSNISNNDDKHTGKITDKYKIPRNKVKSNSKSSSPSITINESNHVLAAPTTYNKNINTITSTTKEHQRQIDNDDNNRILNKEILNELKLNNSQEVTASINSITSDEEDDNETTSDEASSSSDSISSTYSNDNDNESCSEDDEEEEEEEENNDDNNEEDEEDEEDDKREYPSYIIKQNDSSRFLYNEPYESYEPYNMNQYDLTQSSESRKSSSSNSKKKHSKKSKYINLTHDYIKKSRHDNMYYTHNTSNYNSNNNKTSDNINKNSNFTSYTNSPKQNYSNLNINKSHIKKSNYDSSVLKSYNNSNSINNISNSNNIINNNSTFNYNMSYSQQQNSYNPLSSLTYINNNSSNYGSALNNSNNLSMNYSSINIKSNNNIPEKKPREVIKKRKIPQEKKSSSNKTNESLMKLNQLSLGELQNTSKGNTNYNEKSVYQISNSIYHSALNNKNGSINKYNSFNNNKENYNNSNFNQTNKDIPEPKRKPREKEETSNIYKLSHRISKIFSSKKNNSSKRLSQASLDTLQSEKHNGHSSFFTPSFFHNESSKRNSIAIMDTSKNNYFDSEPYDSVEKEKYIVPPKRAHKHIKNCIPKN